MNVHVCLTMDAIIPTIFQTMKLNKWTSTVLSPKVTLICYAMLHYM